MLYVELYLITKKEQVLSSESYFTSFGEGDGAVSCGGEVVSSICKGAGGHRLNRGSSRENVREGKGTREYRGI